MRWLDEVHTLIDAPYLRLELNGWAILLGVYSVVAVVVVAVAVWA